MSRKRHAVDVVEWHRREEERERRAMDARAELDWHVEQFGSPREETGAESARRLNALQRFDRATRCLDCGAHECLEWCPSKPTRERDR